MDEDYFQMNYTSVILLLIYEDQNLCSFETNDILFNSIQIKILI